MAITPGTDVTIQDEPLPRGPIVDPRGGISRQFFNWFQGKDRKLGEIISGVNLNRQNIVQLEVDYQAADGTLSNAYIAADAVVFANSEASNAALSTTLTASYQSADTALQGQITTNAGNITTAQADITTLFSTTATNGSAVSTLQTNLSAEVTNRTNADTNLQGQITTNSGNITTNSANITTLQSASATNTSAIATLTTNLSAETTNRTNADTALQGQITTNAGNISTAQADISTLQSASTTNTSAIATLQTNLSAEVTNRTNADTSLQGQITTNAGNISTNAAAITTEATARASGDAANATSITNLTAAVSAIRVEALPSRPAVATDFTAAAGGSAATVADIGAGTVVAVANEGDVRQFTTGVYFRHKGYLPVVSGRTYRVRARIRTTVDGVDNRSQVGFRYLDSSYANVGLNAGVVDTSAVVADGWQEFEYTRTGAQILAATATAAYVTSRVALGINTGGTTSGATTQAAWVELEDITDFTTNAAAITTEASARASGDSANASLITTLEAKVDTKARTFVQTSAPVATATGDLWVDSDDDNKLYRWNGSSWVAVDDGRIATKTRTFAQTSAPSATATGDLWVDTDDDNKLYRWNGSSWVAVDDQRIGTISASVSNIAEAYATNDSATARLVWKVNTSTNTATIEQTAATGYSDGTWNGSAVKLSADLIELLAEDINFGTNTTYEDTYATLYTTKNNKRLRILGPFPASDDLVLWFGPTTVSLNSETKTNGHFCLATDGKIYLGSAELTNSGNLDFSYTNGFVKTLIGSGTNTTNSVSFTGTGGSGSGYTFAHELIVTYTTGPTVTLSNSTGSPITASATGVVGDEVRFFVQTTMTDSAGNKVTKSKGGGLFWDV